MEITNGKPSKKGKMASVCISGFSNLIPLGGV
jgi:hypothetical protein